MKAIEILFICLIVLSIVFLTFSIFNIMMYFIDKKKVLILKKKVRKKKKYRKELNRVLKRQRLYIKRSIILLVLSVIVSSGYFVIKGYISRHLFSDDLETVMSGYFLVDNYEKNMIQSKESNGDVEDVAKTLADNANRMASYMTETPSDMLSVEGQRVLNKYYRSLSEIGMNTVPIVKEFYGNEELSTEYIQNLKIVKDNQKEVFNYFNIDENRIHKK